jgi:hypothetical protein
VVLLDVTGEREAVAGSIDYLKARTASVQVISSPAEVVYG